jgi:putative hydrolase of the HAD superfamily
MIFFDLDDTLLDKQSATRNAAVDFHKAVGVERPLQEFLVAWHIAQERQYHRYLAKEISFQEQRRARLREVIAPTLSDNAADELFARYVESLESHWVLFDDVLPCFARLSAHSFGLITNGDGALQRRKLEKTGLTGKFNCILISGECGVSKPDKEIFLCACELAGIIPEDALYIGDRYDVDAEGARQAGLRGIWLNRGGNSDHGHTPPIIASLTELDLSSLRGSDSINERPKRS